MIRGIVKFVMECILGGLMVLFILIPHTNSKAYNVGVEKDSGLYGEAIPDDVWEYVEKNCRDAIKIAIDAEAIDIDITENSQIYVMKPYIIVGTEESQNAVYNSYFPYPNNP